MVKKGLFVILVFLSACDGGDKRRAPSSDGPSETATSGTLGCSGNDLCIEKYCEQIPIGSGPFKRGADGVTEGLPPRFFGALEGFGDKRPEHIVVLDGFCIDKYEVTVERYAACVAAGACDPAGCRWLDDSLPDMSKKVTVNHYPEACHDSLDRCPHHPVNCKTYEQAAAYCEWIGRRLCREAEWERAARGPLEADRPVYPWGAGPVDAAHANVAPLGPGHLDRVDAHRPGASREGVLNLTGNVYEWVSDFYAPYHVPKLGRARNPRGPQDGKHRIARGGCFFLQNGHANSDRTTLAEVFDWGCIGIRCCSALSGN
jgi:formylglycine-generating enzyme required for sulfatase activity